MKYWMYHYPNDMLGQLSVGKEQGDRVLVKAITLKDVQEATDGASILIGDVEDTPAAAIVYEIVDCGPDVPGQFEPGMHCDVISGTMDGIDPRRQSKFMHVRHSHIARIWRPSEYADALASWEKEQASIREALLKEKGYS